MGGLNGLGVLHLHSLGPFLKQLALYTVMHIHKQLNGISSAGVSSQDRRYPLTAALLGAAAKRDFLSSSR